MAIEATICLIRNEGRLLLQRKVKGEYAGRWGAPGGKLRPDETPARGAIREVEEETGVRVTEPTYHGTFEACFGTELEPRWLVHIFSANRFSGRLRESSEGPLHWFSENDLPVAGMWPSDPTWLPDLLAGRLEGRRLRATFRFDEGGQRLLDQDITVTDGA